jgi:hypothetical protein
MPRAIPPRDKSLCALHSGAWAWRSARAPSLALDLHGLLPPAPAVSRLARRAVRPPLLGSGRLGRRLHRPPLGFPPAIVGLRNVPLRSPTKNRRATVMLWTDLLADSQGLEGSSLLCRQPLRRGRKHWPSQCELQPEIHRVDAESGSALRLL